MGKNNMADLSQTEDAKEKRRLEGQTPGVEMVE